MIAFLTSSPLILQTEAPYRFILNPANGFLKELRACLPHRKLRGVFAASSPDDFEKNEYFGGEMRDAFPEAGFSFASYTILDRRKEDSAAELIRQADLLLLAGGHVPTQNAFFARIHLKEALQGFGGVVVGISAGSMNAAETVYAHPERPGEASDPAYRRFLPGLGLVRTCLLPHYQEICRDVLDGLRVFEDIAYPDSMGRAFYAIPDGTYLFSRDGREELRGEAVRIRDGAAQTVCTEGGVLLLREKPGEFQKQTVGLE